MRVFITGICGFLGSHLADDLLAKGHTVFGNDNLLCGDIENVPDAAIYFKADCRSFKVMNSCLLGLKIDTLVHCAATAHEGFSVFSPSFITQNIYEASVATFSAAIANGVKHIIFMSSMSRYGKGEPLPPPFIEDVHIPAPEDPYAVAKVAAEQTLKILCREHGVKWTIAVPHNIIGPRQRYVDPFRNVCSIMINRCKQGKPPVVYGDGEQRRCFSPVKDCISSISKMVLEESAVGQVVNIGPDNGEITINELAKIVMETTSYAGPSPEYFPARPAEVKDAFCSSDKARRLLDYNPQQSIKDCIKDMVANIPEGGKPFIYDFPLEILTERTPKTWSKKLI